MASGNVDLNLARIFVILYEERNVTRAARQLSVTQPAVSNALRRLRDIIGDPLFVRSQEGLLPTPIAESLIAPFRQSVAQIETALSLPRSFSIETVNSIFSIKTCDHWIPFIARSVMPALAEEAPRLRLEVIPLGFENVGELRLGDLDILISYVDRQVPTNLKMRKLFTESVGVIVRSGHPLAQKGIDLEAYANGEHVRLRPRYAWHNLPVEKALRAHGITRKERVGVTSILAIPPIVENSDLIASVPEPLGLQFVRDYDVVYFPLPFEAPAYDVMMLWHERAHQDPAHRWLRNRFYRFASRKHFSPYR